MAKNFAEIAFTESVKAQQQHYGSRQQYARIEKLARGTELGADEADFIAGSDGFTPRYTLAEIEALTAPLHQRIEYLEAESKQLKLVKSE